MKKFVMMALAIIFCVGCENNVREVKKMNGYMTTLVCTKKLVKYNDGTPYYNLIYVEENGERSVELRVSMEAYNLVEVGSLVKALMVTETITINK